MPLCSCLHSYGVYQSGRIWVFFELLQGQAFSPLHHDLSSISPLLYIVIDRLFDGFCLCAGIPRLSLFTPCYGQSPHTTFKDN